MGLQQQELIGVLFVALFLPARRSGRAFPGRSYCANNLKQIGLALHQYHDTYHCFPPPYIADKGGRPLYSWRVAILPFLGQQRLYRKWRLDEPWDSPHNRPLAYQSLRAFQCPSDSHTEEACTSYLAVVGPGMAWEQGKCLTLQDFPDGAAETIMVVEMAGSDVNWAAPVDLERATMSLTFNDESQPSISSRHPSVANVLFVDGSVRSLSADPEDPSVETLLTRSGGEPIDWDAFWHSRVMVPAARANHPTGAQP